MAARKEIRDFVLQNRAIQAPKWQDVEIYALRILEAYNERKADDKTLKNDVFELVVSCQLAESRGWQYHNQNYELAIMLLISTAADWDIYLSEEDIKRYKNVRMDTIEDLAQYITDEYKWRQQQGTPPPCAPPEGKDIPIWENVHDENMNLKEPKDKDVLKMFRDGHEYNKFIRSCYLPNKKLKEHEIIVDNYLSYRIPEAWTIRAGGRNGVREKIAMFLKRHGLVTVSQRTILRDFKKALGE